MWRKKEKVEHVTVVVDETNLVETVAALEATAARCVKVVGEAVRKAEVAIAEAKTERGKLETTIAAARKKGQGRW